MKSFLPIAIALLAASAFGFWHRFNTGRIKGGKDHGHRLSEKDLKHSLGSRVTLLQFSSAFCTPCRATKALITATIENMNDVVHIDLDAESNLELVNRLEVTSTPTTLILNAKGIEVGRAVGAPSKAQILSAIAAVK